MWDNYRPKINNVHTLGRPLIEILSDSEEIPTKSPFSIKEVPVYREKLKKRNHIVQNQADSDGEVIWEDSISVEESPHNKESAFEIIDLVKEDTNQMDKNDVEYTQKTSHVEYCWYKVNQAHQNGTLPNFDPENAHEFILEEIRIGNHVDKLKVYYQKMKSKVDE